MPDALQPGNNTLESWLDIKRRRSSMLCQPMEWRRAMHNRQYLLWLVAPAILLVGVGALIKIGEPAVRPLLAGIASGENEDLWKLLYCS